MREQDTRARSPRTGAGAPRKSPIALALVTAIALAWSAGAPSPAAAQTEATRGRAPVPVGAGFGSAEYNPESQVPSAPEEYLANEGVTAFFELVERAAWACLDVLDEGPEPRRAELRLVIDGAGNVAAGYITTWPTKIEVARCLVRNVRSRTLPPPGEAVAIERVVPIDVNADNLLIAGLVNILDNGLPPEVAVSAVGGVEPAMDTREDGARQRLLSLSIAPDRREPIRLPDFEAADVVMYWTRMRTDVEGNPKIAGIVWDTAGIPSIFYGVVLPPG